MEQHGTFSRDFSNSQSFPSPVKQCPSALSLGDILIFEMQY